MLYLFVIFRCHIFHVQFVVCACMGHHKPRPVFSGHWIANGRNPTGRWKAAGQHCDAPWSAEAPPAVGEPRWYSPAAARVDAPKAGPF